jgi:5-hydroxyisourate hydrolase-like protein (transthyretin family)
VAEQGPDGPGGRSDSGGPGATAGASGGQPAGGGGGEEAPAGQGKEAKRTCTIEVTVRVQGEAREGIRVELVRDGNRGRYPAKLMTSATKQDGVASFEGVTPGGWKALAVLEGYTQAKARLLVCGGKDELMKDSADLRRAAVLVFGQITDRGGTPLADSYLEAGKAGLPSDYREILLASVDAEGRYRIWLPDDTQNYRILAGSVGHEMAVKGIPPHESRVELNFKLLRYSVINGTVIGPDGPVPKADLIIQNKPGKSTVITKNGQADDHGRFALEVGPSQVKVAAHKGDLWGAISLPAPAEGKDVYGIVIRMKSGRKLTGTVRLQSGAPAAQVTVAVFEKESAVHTHATTDDRGRFEIDGLPPDRILRLFPLNDKRRPPFLMQEVAPDEDHVEVLFVPE